MYPYMQFMNPFPYQRNEMQLCPYPRPSYEAVPPHMKPYPDGCPAYHTPWPSGGMNGYPFPHLQPYGCCNPNFFPAYGPMSAPCAHPPAHYCGGYPVHPGVHPCHHATPCWTMGPPQFEYQKDAPRSQHCFGCTNDTCKGGKNVKIEDLGPQAETKGDASLVPSSVKDCPYPIVWFPPNYLKGNIGGKESEPMCDKQENAPSSTKSREMLKSSEHQPSSLNGWLPVDISKLISKEDEDSGRKLHKEDEKPYFPFPLFYVPGKADEMGRTDQKDADIGQQCPGRASSGLKADHFMSPELNDSTGTKANEKIVVCQDPRISEKKNGDDVAPMKQGERNEGKKMAQTTKEGNGTSLKHVSNEEKKLAENPKKRTPSPPKSSKLPPVCLRVDPLPKKKNGIGTSKLSSPSGDKEEPFGSSKENIKVPSSAEASSEDKSSRNKMQEQTASEDRPKRVTKTIKVFDATSQPAEDISNTNCGGGVVEGKPAHPAPVEESYRTLPEEKAKADEDSPKEVSLAGNLKEPKKRELSEDEAAKIIQSTYRGYEVRKWEPLKKLKNIKIVQDEASQLKERIEGLKSLPDTTVLDKSRIVIGETIMNLLLKLDSIQGLPASVRQFRKSVASDLVSLQAELDALVQCQTEKSIPSASVTKSDGEVETGDHSCIHEGQENEKLSQQAEQADTDPPRSESCLPQPCQGEGNVDDSVADSKSVDAPELEIEQKDKREIHEEPPLIEISVEDEDKVHKEEIPEVIDRYTMQLNDLWQNGNEALKDKSEPNAFSGTELVDSVLPQSILDDQESCMSVRPGKAEDVIQEDVGISDFIPKMDQAEQQGQLPLKAIDLMDLGEIEEDENIDDCLSWLVPGLPDSEEQASSDLDVAGDQVDEFGTPANAKALSENPLSEATPVCEVREEKQDLSFAENEKASPASDDRVAKVCKGCEEVQDLMQSEIACVTQEQSAITEATDSVSCEDTSIIMNGKHEVPELCQEEHEQKHPDEQLEVQASHLAIEDDNMVAHNPRTAGSEGYPEKDMVSVISIPKRTDGELSPPHSPASSQVSLGSLGSADNERNVIEDNERLREMMQKLIQEGQEQLSAISSLSGKVKDLEKKLSRKKKVRLSRSNGSRAAPGNSCLKLSHRPIREKAVGLAN